MSSPAHSRPVALVAAVLTALAVIVVPAGAEEEPPPPTGDYEKVLDITLPAPADAWFSDSYDACRDDCERRHKAADLMGDKMTPLFAAVGGTVCRISGLDGAEPSWGYALTICGDDGRRYRYLHVNNDTPGTDDGAGGVEHAYADGIRQDKRVARGQHVAYMGDSGNAEETPPHLHFDIFDDDVVDPYGDNRINPYPSLQAALDRGDVPDGSAVHTAAFGRIAGTDRMATAVAISTATHQRADTVVLASATTPAGALVAGPLASRVEGPVLLTPPSALDDRVAAEIQRLGATDAIVVGDLDGITDDVLADAGIGAVTRLGGTDPFAAAAAVATQMWTPAGDGSDLDGVGDLDLARLDEPTLLASTRRDRSAAVLADGAMLPGPAAVFLAVTDVADVTEVVFTIDGRHRHVERTWPYDLAGSDDDGAQLLDPADLGPGDHTIRADVHRSDGSTLEVEADITTSVEDAPRTAIVALGTHPDPNRSWPDALMGSYLGAATGAPVLLVGPDDLPEATADALAGVSAVTVLGGNAAVSDDVYAAIEDRVGDVERISGSDRFATAAAVAARVLDDDLAGAETLWIATGLNWPDAVTVGPAAIAGDRLLALVDGTGGGPDGVSRLLTRLSEDIRRVEAIGGPAAVSDRALERSAYDAA